MLKSVKLSLLLQSLVFAMVFTGFFMAEARRYPDANYFDSLLAYVTWVPAMWGGIFGGLLTYLLLMSVVFVSLARSIRESPGRWVLPLFNISAFLWTVFPWISYHLGSYRGP